MKNLKATSTHNLQVLKADCVDMIWSRNCPKAAKQLKKIEAELASRNISRR